MRTVRIPEGALDVTGMTAGSIDFAWFIRSMLNSDARFNNAGVGIRAAVRIERAIEKAVAAEGVTEKTFFLDESDWQLLRDVCEAPGSAYPLSPARVLSPYIDAVLNAK